MKKVVLVIDDSENRARELLKMAMDQEPSLKSSRLQTPTECCTAVSEANVQHEGNRRLVARSAAPQEPSVSRQDVDILEWCKNSIHGSGGFHSWEDHECVAHVDREVAIVAWTIRCLANPLCDGTKEILESINERREKMKDSRLAC